MKHTILAFICTGLFGSIDVLAQTIYPDGHGEDYNRTIGYWAEHGQTVYANGNPFTTLQYYTDGCMPAAYMQRDGLVSFVVVEGDGTHTTQQTFHKLNLRMVGESAQYPDATPYVVQDYVQNYYFAHCTPGVEQVEGYYRIIYEDIYPGIDWHFYSGSMGQKTAIVCEPGSDPNNILMEFTGQDSLRVDVWGALRAYMDGQWIVLNEAIAYQVDANNTVIPLNWTAAYTANNGSGTVHFTFDTYDTTLPLILQIGAPPMGGGASEQGLCWSTYLGGNGKDSFKANLSTNLEHFVAGESRSTFASFPFITGTSYGMGGMAATVVKFDDVNQIEWKTFFGGINGESTGATCMAKRTPVQGGGLYVAGSTGSQNLSHQQPGNEFYEPISTTSSSKGWLGRFSPATGVRQWSTYFGTADVAILGIAAADNGRLYIGGRTYGNMPPLDDAAPNGSVNWPYDANDDGFVASFNDQDRLNWTTFLPGSEGERVEDLEVHGSNLVVAGHTESANMIMSAIGAPAFEEGFHSGADIFVYHFTFDGALVWSTYLGGPSPDRPGTNGIGIDPLTGDILICGQAGPGMTLVPGSGWFQASTNLNNGYIARIEDSSHSLLWQTYVRGGTGSVTVIEAVACGADGRIFLAGRVDGSGYPFQAGPGRYNQSGINADLNNGINPQPWDGFAMEFTTDQLLTWWSPFGGNASSSGVWETIWSVAVHQNTGSLYAAGETSKDLLLATYFPLDDGQGVPYFEPAFQSGVMTSDCFVTVFCDESITAVGSYSSSSGWHAFVGAGGTLFLSGVSAGTHAVALRNVLGQAVHEGWFTGAGAGLIEVRIPRLASGTYVITVDDRSRKLFIP